MAESREPHTPGETRLLDPDVALLAGRADALRLSLVWLVRHSFVGLVFLGIIVGVVAAEAANEDAALFVDTSSADAVAEGVFTRFGLVFAAIVIRILTHWAALALAYPVARSAAGPLEPTTTLRGRVDARIDRLDLARAFASLRWTRPVRDAAIARLGREGTRLELAGRVVGWANIVSVAAAFLVIVLFGAEIQF